MKRKMLFIIGAVLAFGAVITVAAVAQYAEMGKKERGAHECTQGMMESPDKIMEGCSSMMERDDHMADPDHCGSSMIGTPEGSMMQQL